MVSVIIPVYNAADYLKQMVSSVQVQTYGDLEIILVDDGSIDGSAEICKQLANEDSRIRYVYKENGGVSTARNLGLSMAMGDYICIFDSDDVIEPDMIAGMVEKMEETPRCELVICGIKECRQDMEFSILPERTGVFSKNELSKSHPHLFRNSLINSCANKLYKKDLIRHTFDETMCLGEDLMFNLAYLDDIDRIYFMPDTFYHYLIRSSSLNHTYRDDMADQMTKLYNAKKTYLRKWGFEPESIEEIRATYMTFIFYSLTSMYKSSELSLHQCKKRMREILDKPEVREAVQAGKVENPRQRIFLVLARHGMYGLLHILLIVRKAL